MKLSEAIRAGAVLRPQCTNGYYISDGCSCALGAAAEAVGIAVVLDNGRYSLNGEESFIAQAVKLWPELHICMVDLDGVDRQNARLTLGQHIVDLNDTYRNTREEIADIVAKLGY